MLIHRRTGRARHCDLDEGMARLTTLLGGLADLPVEQLCDRVLDGMLTGHADDDVALLALRCHPQDARRASAPPS